MMFKIVIFGGCTLAVIIIGIFLGQLFSAGRWSGWVDVVFDACTYALLFLGLLGVFLVIHDSLKPR